MSAITSNPTEPITDTVAATDIEQLIYNIAEHARDEDYAQLYQNLLERELFIPVEQSSLQSSPELAKSGATSKADSNTALQIRNIEGPRGEPFVPVVTTQAAPILAEAHVAIDWPEALTMVLKIEAVAGILLQGKNSWICFYKPQIENILKIYGDSAK